MIKKGLKNLRDLSLVDIEENILKKLQSSCDMNQEALEYIKNDLSTISSFGTIEERNILIQKDKTISKINNFDIDSSIPLIKKIIEVFSKTNLSSLKSTYFSNVFIFHSPQKQHTINISLSEKVYKDLLLQKETYLAVMNFFEEIQVEEIKILEEIDKCILLGKCIHHLLSENPEKYIKELTILQERIFQMEITKNIPLQIISKIHGIQEIINTLLILFDKNLTPDFSLYLSSYRESLNLRKEKKKVRNLEKLQLLYLNILRDIKNLEIIDEDLEEKFQDFKDGILLLNK